MVNKYEVYKKEENKRLDTFPIFFAFSNAQFEEGRNRLGAKDNMELLSIGAGGYILKKDKDIFIQQMEDRDTALKNFLKHPENLKDALIYELFDHEYSYTNEVEPALNSLGLSLSSLNEEQMYILQDAVRYCLENSD